MTTPRRRWFAFSLRTMFVGIALVATPLGWIGWQLHVVREREREHRALEHDGAEISGIEESLARANFSSMGGYNSPDRVMAQLLMRCRLPRIREWLGDKAIVDVELPFEYDDSDLARVKATFPEANVVPFNPVRH